MIGSFSLSRIKIENSHVFFIYILLKKREILDILSDIIIGSIAGLN